MKQKSCLPQTLKRILQQRGISQRKLADMAAVPLSSINGMLAGRRSYSTDNLIAVSDALEVSLDLLLKDSPGAMVTLDSIASTVVLDGAYRITLSRLDIPNADPKQGSKK